MTTRSGSLPKITITIGAPRSAKSEGVGYPEGTDIMPVTWSFYHNRRKHSVQHNGVVINDDVRANPSKLEALLRKVVDSQVEHAYRSWNAIHDPSFPHSTDAPPACTNPKHIIDKVRPCRRST